MEVAFATNKIVEPKSSIDPADFLEKRNAPRSRTLDISEILAGVGNQHTCMVHDISDTGAKLEVTSSDLPERFILANHIKRTRTLCRVVWRNGNFLGVRFLNRPKPFPLSEDN